MSELREKKNLIYNVSVDNYTTPYGTYLTIEVSSKNKNIRRSYLWSYQNLKNSIRGKFIKNILLM